MVGRGVIFNDYRKVVEVLGHTSLGPVRESRVFWEVLNRREKRFERFECKKSEGDEFLYVIPSIPTEILLY